MTTIDLESLLAALDAGDRMALLGLADFYEERGEALCAEAYRWVWSKGRWPRDVTAYHVDAGHGKGWDWYDATYAGNSRHPESGILPDVLIDAINGHDKYVHTKNFKSLRVAFGAVARGFTLLSSAGLADVRTWETASAG